MRRAKFPTLTFYMHTEADRSRLVVRIQNLPIDSANPLEVVIREKPQGRTPDQNALMWAGPLKDFEEQGYVENRTYPANVWHEHFKGTLLPEGFDPLLCKDGYKKWDYTPNGIRVLVGSTTQLTQRGMSEYLEQMYAVGSAMGIQFKVDPRLRIAA